jgi:hypothetical protein
MINFFILPHFYLICPGDRSKWSLFTAPTLSVPHLDVPHCHNSLILHVVISGSMVHNMTTISHLKKRFILIFRPLESALVSFSLTAFKYHFLTSGRYRFIIFTLIIQL